MVGRKDKTMEARMFTQNVATINGRNIGHYLIDTDIGQISVIQYEKPDRCIATELIYNDWDKAEKKFSSICKQILDGKR